MEGLIKAKYQKKYIDAGLMMVPALPELGKFNMKHINSKEAFKRALDIFLACLISYSQSHKFNYVCREALLFLDLNGPLFYDKTSM